MSNSTVHNYVINGFAVNSALHLPCQEDVTNLYPYWESGIEVEYRPDALVEFSSVHWICRRNAGYFRAYAADAGILICGPSFRVHAHLGGKKITVDYREFDPSKFESLDQAINATVTPAYVAALVANVGLSLCTLLQGKLPLHGVLIELDGRLIGILAPSGTGKSTLLWSLLDHGAYFASDDVFPVHEHNGRMIAVPSMSLHAKLSKEALSSRDMDWREFKEAIPGGDEFWIPIAQGDRILAPRLLDALFVLQPKSSLENPETVSVHQVIGGAAISLLIENTQGLWAATSALNANKLMAQYSAIIASVPIMSIQYVRSFAILPTLIGTIREIIKSPVFSR